MEKIWWECEECGEIEVFFENQDYTECKKCGSQQVVIIDPTDSEENE